ncbi:uncharacterized protein LOC129592944 [Paramacrobiotus metropolitanus]|uniref:uncharacterized protein LOC129592944 n=1 Tax=Paramacrobiotus metropolitanus TaxID=2943436 RepID=UPI002446530D|nr:uncharacterized protein LOC129592944 [Paramacrobiotus metropolitanus]
MPTTYQLNVDCRRSAVALHFILHDYGADLAGASILVGGGGDGCGIFIVGDTLSPGLNLAGDTCGRTHDPTNKQYKWRLVAEFYPAPVGGVSFEPFVFPYTVVCKAATAINMNLEDHGISATSQLEVSCNGKNVVLNLINQDPADELQKSVLVVGNSGEASCTSKDITPDSLTVNTAADTVTACSRRETLSSDSSIVSYTWLVTVNHYPEPRGTAAKPLTSTHTVTCDVALDLPAAVTDNQQPEPETGENVAGNSQTVALQLVKDPSSTNKVWLLTLSPLVASAIPVGLSYKLDTCTATPPNLATPVFNLIQNGCITPKSGVKATFDAAKKEYKLTVRAFGFTGQDGTVSVQCTATLCQADEETSLCVGQTPSVTECGKMSLEARNTKNRNFGASDKSGSINLASRHLRSVRSTVTWIKSNSLII